ncbi:hypothetical protein HORIV_36580 [Vreelandella olivaria]|uniref:DUF4403 family protein n=1 Tax=Vreelandella olivaria TaxID=390919 RepID=A0ABN5WWM2_9GAMM|nr:hypothetical protein HORIV_36580 [Halomonas olivaria]
MLDHFQLEDFQLQLGETRISVDEFELQWADDCVLSGRLCIDTLRVVGADIQLGPSSEQAPPPEEEGSPLAIRFPFPIELRSLLLDDVNLRLADGTEVAWHSLSSAAIAEGNTVRLSPTHLEQPRVYLPPSSGVLLTQGIETPLQAEAIDAAILLNQPPQEALAAVESPEQQLEERERLELPEITLPVDIQLPEFTLNDFRLEGAAEYRVERLRLGLLTEGDHVEVTELSVVTPDAEAELTANATLTGNYPLEARLAVELFLPEIYPELSGESLTLTLSGPLDALEAQLDASGAVNASLRGKSTRWPQRCRFNCSYKVTNYSGLCLSVQVRVAMRASMAALKRRAQAYIVDDLDLQVTGSLSDYSAQVALAVEGPSLPRTQINVTGEGDLKQFSWQPLTLAVGKVPCAVRAISVG